MLRVPFVKQQNYGFFYEIRPERLNTELLSLVPPQTTLLKDTMETCPPFFYHYKIPSSIFLLRARFLRKIFSSGMVEK